MSQILLTFTVVIALIVAAVLGATVILFIGWGKQATSRHGAK